MTVVSLVLMFAVVYLEIRIYRAGAEAPRSHRSETES